MAEAVSQEAAARLLLHQHGDPRLRNQRKRKRLNAVLDKISNHISSRSKTTYANGRQDSHSGNNNDIDENNEQLGEKLVDNSSMFGGTEQNQKQVREGPGLPIDHNKEEASFPPQQQQRQGETMNQISFRRELWRDLQPEEQQRRRQETMLDSEQSFLLNLGATLRPPPHSQDLALGANFPGGGGVFKFDSFDRDRYPVRGARSSCDEPQQKQATLGHYYFGSGSAVAGAIGGSHDVEGSGDFSPASGRSPHSSLSSPHVSMDSPRICFSPLRIKDAIDEEDEAGRNIQR